MYKVHVNKTQTFNFDIAMIVLLSHLSIIKSVEQKNRHIHFEKFNEKNSEKFDIDFTGTC